MDTRLVEYLKNVVALEKSVYIQRETIQRIKFKICNLGIRSRLVEPEPPEKELPSFEGTLSFAFIFMLIFGIFNVGLMIPGAVFGFCLVLYINYRTVTKRYEERMGVYWQKKHQYDKALYDECLRLDRENSQKAKLIEMLKTMENHLYETRILLRRYYMRDIIFEKYQNIVAVCSFYEYLLSGRCTTLTGHEGAYNIYETEARFERIYTKLDEIVTKLDDIKQNQYVLYDAIQDGNRMTRRLVDESLRQATLTAQIADNAELAAYYNRQTAIEANQIKWLMLNDSWKSR